MIRYFDSGLYEVTFYAKHHIDFYSDYREQENVEYNSELLAEYYKDNRDFEYSDEDDKWEQVNEEFWEALGYWNIYFAPLIFDEQIALECGLTPFTYKGAGMLALSGCGMNLGPKLDAYQALTHNTIDRNSRLFPIDDKGDEYFRYVVGEEVTKKVLAAISK